MKFDMMKMKAELSDEQLADINGGVTVDLGKSGMATGTMDVTPEFIDGLDKAGQLGSLIMTFQYLGSLYVDEIRALYKEYEGSDYKMPAQLDDVLRQYR